MNRARKIILLSILTTMLVGSLIAPACSLGRDTVRGSEIGNLAPDFQHTARGSEIGNLAPDFQLDNLDGQSVSLSDFRGKPVLVNFWASWCPPCRSEMPFIQDVFADKEWVEEGLVVLAIDIGESPSTVREFVKTDGLTFPVLLDITGDMSNEYRVRAIPTTFFINREGIIQDIRIGPFSSSLEIERSLREIIR